MSDIQINNNIVLSAQNLTIGYKKGKEVIKKVHSGLNFSLKKGELTCLLGPNGTGKSTLLRTISSTQSPISGSILLSGKNLSDYSPRQLSKEIALVLTERIHIGGLRVKELVALGRHPHTGFFGRLSQDDSDIVEMSMLSTGISDKRDRFVAELSDGERQKAMIAKALAQQSPIIILDEPTSFLDIVSRIEVMNLLRRLAREQNKAVLLSTHDLEQALIAADALWLLYKDEGMICGCPEDLVLNDRLSSLFGHNEIGFDKRNGCFRYHNISNGSVLVKGSDTQFHWSKNFLQRYGFLVLSESETELNGEKKMTDGILGFDSTGHIKFDYKGLHYQAPDFESLKNCLTAEEIFI